MTSVTVVAAFNRCNAGMYSVDLAAKQFLGELGLQARFVETQADLPSITQRKLGRHRTEIVRDPRELLKGDALLYWGDFLNSPMYAIDDYRRRELKFGYSKTDAEALAVWKKLFVLSGEDRGNTKVMAVSGNFQSSDTAMASLPEAERAEIAEAFRASFDAIYPRDPASTEHLRAAVPDAARGELKTGLDAAFLLSPEKVYPWLKLARESRTFTYFFNRSKLQDVDRLLATIERETGLKAVRLRGWNNMHKPVVDMEFAWNLSRLKRSAFVLTDTYHCAINTMNLRRPVIGIGRPSAKQETTLSDFKKRVLFDMFGLSEMYVEMESQNAMGGGSERILDQARRYASGDWSGEATYAELARQVEEYRARLTDQLLGQPMAMAS